MLDSRSRPNGDALPPKPTFAGGGCSLSYSAQVTEQFSSAYRQTPSQERGRLDPARLAQFQAKETGAPSGSTGPGSADAARPIRPSEIKDEGCVFLLLSTSSIVLSLYVKGSVPPLPVEQCVSYLSVVSKRTTLPLLHAFTRCYGELGRPRASRTVSSYFHILLPR